MLRSTARISTPRADRYREQLARHGAGMLRQSRHGGGQAGPPIRDATSTEDALVLDLAWGRCTVTTDVDTLVLVAEAATTEDLGRIQAGVGQRVVKIGRRDGLEVTWSPTEGEQTDDSAHDVAATRHAGVLGGIALAALVGVIIVVHLGLGAVLIRQQWTWWALTAVGAIVVLKLVVARHLMSSIRRHRFHRSWRS